MNTGQHTPSNHLSDVEIEDMAFEEILEAQEARNSASYERACFNTMEASYDDDVPTFRIRAQRIAFIELDVRAGTLEEAEEKALKILKSAPEMGRTMRVDFGHRTIEKLGE